MFRWAITIIGIGVVLVIGVALTGHLWLPPAPPPTPTPIPIALETPIAEGPIHAVPVLVDVKQVVQFDLVEAWHAAYLGAGESEATLRQFAGVENELEREAARTLIGSLAKDATVLAARYGAVDQAETDPTLLVLAMERNGLGLDSYVEEVRTQLAAQGAIILTAEVNTDYRGDHLPVGLLRYSLPAGPASGTSALQSGLQLVALDRTGDLLVLFTLNAPAERVADLSPLAVELLRSVNF